MWHSAMVVCVIRLYVHVYLSCDRSRKGFWLQCCLDMPVDICEAYWYCHLLTLCSRYFLTVSSWLHVNHLLFCNAKMLFWNANGASIKLGCECDCICLVRRLITWKLTDIVAYVFTPDLFICKCHWWCNMIWLTVFEDLTDFCIWDDENTGL